MMNGFRFPLAAVAAALLLPCGVVAQTITLSAAASLTNAFKDLGRAFEASVPGTTVRLNFAASGVLLQQISEGAPVDVFASADQATMDRAAKDKLIEPDSRTDFATNSVVLVEPAIGGPALTSLADLGKPQVSRIAVGKTATVPVGRYTKEALESAGLWDTLAPKYVQADSVRQVLDYVGRGDVEAGFVYRTDAALMPDKVKIVLTVTGHTPVSYPVAVIRESRQKDLAARFVDFLSGGPAAREILAGYGFGRP